MYTNRTFTFYGCREVTSNFDFNMNLDAYIQRKYVKRQIIVKNRRADIIKSYSFPKTHGNVKKCCYIQLRGNGEGGFVMIPPRNIYVFRKKMDLKRKYQIKIVLIYCF